MLHSIFTFIQYSCALVMAMFVVHYRLLTIFPVLFVQSFSLYLYIFPNAYDI